MQTQAIDCYAIYLAAILLGVLALWVLVVSLAAVLARVLRGRARLRAVAIARLTMPRWLFRLTVGAAAAGIALAPATAGAAPAPLPAPALPLTPAATALPTPGLPVTRTPEAPAPRVPAPQTPPRTPPADSARPGHPGRPAVPAPASVTVGPGDSLWSLAAEQLGPSASPRAIAQQWPAWWAANRAVIGDDPDLIHPGQHLVPPTGGHP